MLSISGELQAGEANGVLSTIAARQRGPAWHFYAAMAALIWGGALAFDGLAALVNFASGRHLLDSGFMAFLGLIVGWMAYARLCRPWIVRRFRRRMQARGLGTQVPHALTITDEGLTLDNGVVFRTAKWSAATELFRAKAYWIFLVQMEPWFAPKRFFPDVETEKTFIRAALSNMSEEARARSHEAVDFAST